MKKTKLYLTAPLAHGSDSFYIRRAIRDYCMVVMRQCGYDVVYEKEKSERVVIVAIPGWEQCGWCALVIEESMRIGRKIEVVELEEFL